MPSPALTSHRPGGDRTGHVPCYSKTPSRRQACWERGRPGRFVHRDPLAASQHMAIRWDDYAERYGRVALGLDPSPTAFL